MKSIAELSYERGVQLHQAGDVEGALAAYDHCLSLSPGQPAALYNRAGALTQLQRWEEALAALDAVLRQSPTMADAWNNRSGVLQAMGRYEEALASIQQVLQRRPSDARALYNAGLMLLLLKRFDQSQLVLARLVALQPGNGEALGSLAAAALQACDWDDVERLLPRILAGILDGAVFMSPLSLLALSDDPVLQLRCARMAVQRILADTALGSAAQPAMARQPYRHDRLRIGYLSSDFRDHPVANQIVGVLEKHDRSRFDVIGLFTGRADASPVHRRIVKACDSFHAIGAMGSREAARLIRDAEIDILVDLNGHTMGWRPAILAYRPAPVIASYLGYAGTTGSGFVDYVIGDARATPFTLAPAMSEKIVQLRHGFWPSDPMGPMPETVSREEAGLPADAFVFCCFNAPYKIRPAMFDVWVRLLHAVPGSVLWLRDSSAVTNERFRQQARKRGLDEGRIVFAGRMDSFARHLGRLAQADLFLDTAPYNAHATAADALWAGLPVITLQGESFVSRVCASLLFYCGLGELVTTTATDYEALALALARDGGRLAALRRRLVDARKAAPLFGMDAVVTSIEDAYLEMQARVQRGEAAQQFAQQGAALSI